MKKRLICLTIICCVLFALLFSGCTNNSNVQNTTTTIESTTESTTESSTESTTESTTESSTETTTEGTTESSKENSTENKSESTTKEKNTSDSVETTKKKQQTTTTKVSKEPYTSSSSAKKVAKSYFNDVAFIGDSISLGLRNRAFSTRKLPGATFLARECFGSGRAVNGTMLLIYQGKEMYPEDAIKASGVKKVFIMLGMNDLNTYGVQGSVDYMEKLIKRIKNKCPDVKIYIQSMTPIVVGSEVNWLNNTSIDKYNSLLKSLAKKNGYKYVNVAKYLKDSANGLNPKYSSDNYVHLNFTGLDIWISALENYAKTETKPENTTKKETTTEKEKTTEKVSVKNKETTTNKVAPKKEKTKSNKE